MKATSIVLICLALIGMAAIAAHNVPAARGATPNSEQRFDGVWVSQGYGWLWEIADGRIARFDIGEGFCIPRSSRTRPLRPRNRAELSDNGRTLRLLMDDPAYFYTFDRVNEVPERCRQRPPGTPHHVLDVFVEMFDAHYAFFEQRGVNWEQAVETARSGLRARMSDAELFRVLGKTVSMFRDGHVGLEARIDGDGRSVYGSDERLTFGAGGPPAVAGAWNRRAAVASLDGARSDGALVYGRLADDVGYLQVRSMSGMDTNELEAALDTAMTRFEDAAAVVVDVSGNDGGDDTFARLIARRFAATPTVAYSKRAGDYEGASPQEIVLEPPARPKYLGPVYLITSRRTASAAEIFAMSMRAFPNVVHLGDVTDGSLSDTLSKRLPNGWRLNLSNEVYLDSDGGLWEGTGIPPEIPLEISEKRKVTRKSKQAVRDLVQFIRMRM